LVERGPRRGARARTAEEISPALGSPGEPAGMPIGTTRNSPVCHLPGATRWPTLAVEADGDVGANGLPLDLAGGGVDPGGDVAGDHRSTAPVDRPDRRGGGLPRSPVKAGAEDRIDDHARAGKPSTHVALDQLPPRALVIGSSIPPQLLPRPEQQDIDLEPHPPQVACRNEPVSAVVPLPTNHPHRPVRSQPRHNLGHSPPGSLHQLQRRNPKLLDRPPINSPHPLSVIKRPQPTIHTPSLRPHNRHCRKEVRVSPGRPASCSSPHLLSESRRVNGEEPREARGHPYLPTEKRPNPVT